MYLESRGTNFDLNPPFMRYNGDSFCVTGANVKGRWIYVDYKSTNLVPLSTDPPIIVTCSNYPTIEDVYDSI